MKTLPTLTALETKVYDALKAQAIDCSGGDFAITEEVDYRALKLSAAQFGALVTTLQTKGLIWVSVTYINSSLRSKGTKVTQVSFLLEELS